MTAAETPLTKEELDVIIEPKLTLGPDRVLKFPYHKGKRLYTEKIVRVRNGTVYVLDPSTKEQIAVGKALWMGNVLVIAMTVRTE